MSALYDADTLSQMYEMAIGDAAYSFWYVDMTQRKKEDMFWIRFEKRMKVKE